MPDSTGGITEEQLGELSDEDIAELEAGASFGSAEPTEPADDTGPDESGSESDMGVSEAKDIVATIYEEQTNLSPKQQAAVNAMLAAVKAGEKELTSLQEKGEVPAGASLYDVSEGGGISYITKEEKERVAARGKAFVQASSNKKAALDALVFYKVGEGYNLVEAIKDGKIGLVRKAQKAGAFLPEDIVEAQLQAAGKVRPIRQKVAKPLMSLADVVRLSKKQLDEAKAKAETRKISRFEEGSILYMGRGGDFFIPVDPEKTKATKDLFMLQSKVGAGAVPAVGTALWWKDMTGGTVLGLNIPGPVEKGANIALDVLALSSLMRPIRSIRMALKGKKAVDVTDTIKTGQNIERATIKAWAPKEVVKHYDDWTRASKRYAELSDAITAYELAQKGLPKGVTLSAIGHQASSHLDDVLSIRRYTRTPGRGNIENAKVTINQLRNKTLETGEGFAKAQREALAKKPLTTRLIGDVVTGKTVELSAKSIGKAGLDQPMDFARRHVKTIDQTISQIYAGKHLPLEKATKQLNRLIRDLEMAKHDQDFTQIQKLSSRIIETQQNIKIAKSGRLVELEIQRGKLLDKLAAGKLSAKEAKALRAKKVKLDKDIEESFKNLAIDWAKPYTPRGGRVITRTPTAPVKPFLGGGARTTTQQPPLINAIVGAKLLARTGDTEEWSLPAVRTIDVPGKETVTVEPQPYWAGEVETADPATKPATKPFIPETKPATRPPFEPSPGRITWTPAVVVVPRIKGQEAVIIQAKPGTSPSAATKQITKARNAYKAAVATGTTPQQAIKKVTSQVPGTTLSVVTNTQLRTMQKTQAKTRIATEPQPGGQVAPGTPVSTTTTTMTDTPPSKPLKPIIKAKSLSKKEIEELTPKQLKSATTFKMGIGWWIVLADGRKGFTRSRPAGAKVGKPSNKPSATIQTHRGKPISYTADLGIVDIEVNKPGRTPGERGKISFAADPGRRTRSDIKLGRGSGLKSKRVGKFFHTKVKGGKLLSRRRLR